MLRHWFHVVFFVLFILDCILFMRIVIVVNWWCVLVHIGYISWNLSTRYKLVLNCLWSRWQETLMWLGWQNSVIGRGVWGMGLCRQERQQVFEFTLKSWPFNLLKPNDIYICHTAALTSRRYILNIYSTNIHTEYFKHAA